VNISGGGESYLLDKRILQKCLKSVCNVWKNSYEHSTNLKREQMTNLLFTGDFGFRNYCIYLVLYMLGN